MDHYTVDILAVGFFALEWLVYAMGARAVARNQ